VSILGIVRFLARRDQSIEYQNTIGRDLPGFLVIEDSEKREDLVGQKFLSHPGMLFPK
jgi:hypothetical protein